MSILKTSNLLNLKKVIFQPQNLYHCWIAGVTKVGRKIYKRKYPIFLVNPDGSTQHIQYEEPLGIIKLPINLNLLSEEERQKFLEKRKPKSKIILEDELEDDFDESQYVQMKNK